ncbi:MAG: PAS domain S-box protein [Kofleriaceae bacterium]|nr:PAS domain S-box protein [Kofleriaceae bacterium]
MPSTNDDVADWQPRERTAWRLLDAVTSALAVTRADGTIVFASRGMLALLARPRERLVGQAFDSVLSEPSRAAYQAALSKAVEAARDLTFAVVLDDGSERTVDASLERVVADDGVLVAIRLREPFDRTIGQLASIVNAAEDAIFSIARGGAVRTWNDGAERMFGYTRDEIVGRSVSVLLPPDSRDFEEIAAKLRRGEIVSRYETVRRRKDGSLVDVSLTVGPLVAGDSAHGYAAIARDITQGKRMAAQLERAERVAALGRMATRLGHEINSPLGVILANVAYARELLSRITEASNVTELRELLEDTEAASTVIRQFMKEMSSLVASSADGEPDV